MSAERRVGQDNREMHWAEVQPQWLTVVRTQVESLKFGNVQITVHDSKVVQIERVEKTRLDQLQGS